MKRSFLAGVAALSLVTVGAAFAQHTIVVEPNQRTVIREYVVKQKVKPITIKEKVVVGATLPTDVALVTVPSEWGPSFSKYRYVYWDNRVVLVEPSSRRVVHIVD
jgi:hypothetical protein